MTGGAKILPTRPENNDPDRREHQAQVKTALLRGQSWGLTYLLARVKDHDPYDNYSLPKDLEAFEFSVKGVLRLEMLGNPTYRGWRRLFGSNTKAHDISTWRSRTALKAFKNSAEALEFIRADPLWEWQLSDTEIPKGHSNDGWHGVFQVQDVWVAKDRYRWSEMLAAFLLNESRIFELVGLFEPVPSVLGRNHE